MESTSSIILVLFMFLISVWLLMRKHSKGSLPGPTGLPLLGYLPFLTKKPFVKLTELSKTYGPVFRVQLGAVEVVVLADYPSIKEAYMKDAFMGRPPIVPFELNEVTIATGAFNNLAWKEQRNFSLHTLRDLGFGKSRMEEQLKEEILELLELMSERADKPIQMGALLATSMSNNVSALVFGRRLKHSDPERQKLDRVLREVGRLAGAISWQLFFPWIRTVVNQFNIGDKAKLSQALTEIKEYCMKQINEHEKTFDANNIRDFVDGYLVEIEKRRGDPNSAFRKEVLSDLARAFFGAGSRTTRVTLDWILLVIADHPEVQKKIHAEIEEVLGQDRFPTWQDRLKMPYTEAALMEVMRWKTIVPLNNLQYTLQDTEVNGYFIPKHTRILSVPWAVDHNKKLWGDDVFEYRPERFLSEDGQKCVKPEYFIPFSIGKRSCPGKTLAEIEVFLYSVAILRKFEISCPPGKKVDYEGVLGISLDSKKQEICLKKRF